MRGDECCVMLRGRVCVCVHVREMKKEGKKKQARSNKQQGKATQHTQGSHFS